MTYLNTAASAFVLLTTLAFVNILIQIFSFRPSDGAIFSSIGLFFGTGVTTLLVLGARGVASAVIELLTEQRDILKSLASRRPNPPAKP